MKNEGLMTISEVRLDFFKERSGKIAIFLKKLAIFEVDEVDFWRDGGGFGFGGEGNTGVISFCEMVVSDKRGGGALETGNF